MSAVERTNSLFQTMVQMVADQCFFGFSDRFFDSVKLLRNIKAGTPGFNHFNRAAQVAIGAFEPQNDVGMGCVLVSFTHIVCYPPGEDIVKWSGLIQTSQVSGLFCKLGLAIVLVRKTISVLRIAIAVALAMVLVVDQSLNIIAHSPVQVAATGIDPLVDSSAAKDRHGHSSDDRDFGSANSRLDGYCGHIGHSSDDHSHEPGMLAYSGSTNPLALTQKTIVRSDRVKLPERLRPPERPPRHS